jgi:hypothetical protein
MATKRKARWAGMSPILQAVYAGALHRLDRELNADYYKAVEAEAKRAGKHRLGGAHE